MIGKQIIRRGPARTATVLAGMLVLLAAVLLATSLTQAAISQGMTKGGEERTLKGEVIAVDNVNNINVLTLRSDEIGKYPNDTMNIFLKPSTTVKICNAREPARDINVSRNAMIRYHELAGFAVADSVSERC